MLALLACITHLNAQSSLSIINSSGTTLTNGSSQLTYTLGEVAIQLNDGLEEGFLAGAFLTLEEALGFQNPTLELEELAVYPNPAQGWVTVIDTSSKVEMVMIYDVQGRLALTTDLENQRFNVADLTDGMYTLLFTTTSESAGTSDEIVARTVMIKN